MMPAINPGLGDGTLKARYQRGGRLMNLHLDLLYACDLDCHHCYLDDKRRPQTPFETLVDVLRQAADMGALQLLLSGGEIFLRKDLFDILEEARRLRFHIRLKTHGGNITAEDAARLKALGVAQVDFSVYALEASVHDAFTQKRGSLQRTLDGIDHLVAAGVPVEVKCSVTSYNLSHYRELVEHFRARDIPCSFNAKIRGTNSLEVSTYPLNVAMSEKVELELWRLEQAGGPRPYGPVPAPERSHFCSAGRSMLYVAPDLEVYPCVSYPQSLGNLATTSLAELWGDAPGLAPVRAATRADTGVCPTCPARLQCSYCPGAAYIESGHALTPPEIVCATAFARLDAEQRWARGQRPQGHAAPKRPRFTVAVNLPKTPEGQTAQVATGASCGCG